jgi:hypothetical protein
MNKKPECTWCGQYWKGGGKCPDCQTYRYVDGPVLNPETGEATSKEALRDYVYGAEAWKAATRPVTGTGEE